jgi:glycosyltransferase involved in cell wall biosynthesis
MASSRLLQELVAVPDTRVGWPWTEQSPSLPARPVGSRGVWPRLTIVTPSFNQSEFIEETIRSVLLQGYPDLEYIVVDGGSTDGSVDIIRKYAPWLSYWVSEPDRGQAHAINKGFGRATGQIAAYINSDDVYLPGAFAIAADALMRNPQAQWLCSACISRDDEATTTALLEPQLPVDPARWLFKPSGQPYCFPQPGVFLRTSLIETLGEFREDLQYSFDYEYFQRILFAGFWPIELDATVAMFRIHQTSKTATHTAGFAADDLTVAELYFDRVSRSDQRRLTSQKHRVMAWRTLDSCVALAERQGERVALRTLLTHLLRDPQLLRYRPVWGAVRRWCGWIR